MENHQKIINKTNKDLKDGATVFGDGVSPPIFIVRGDDFVPKKDDELKLIAGGKDTTKITYGVMPILPSPREFKALRLKFKLSRRQVGEQIKIAQSTIAKFENELHQLNYRDVRRLWNYYQCKEIKDDCKYMTMP